MPITARLLSAVALAAAVAAPLAALAQQAPPAAAPPVAAPGASDHRDHRHRGWMHRLRDLHLSPAQRERIEGLVADARARSQNADPATRKAIRADLRVRIEGVLTPEQRAKLAAEAPHRRANPE